MAVRLDGGDHPLTETDDGVWEGQAPAAPGDDYRFVLDGADAWPDPCSRWQPEGVRGPSRILDTSASRSSRGRRSRSRSSSSTSFTSARSRAEGTFDGVIPRLAGLRELGVTAIELMPVATFPGSRGWGYDGLYPFAPHPAYGGPQGLARLVDAAHREGLGVVLDVVYNHIGPGNEALGAFGPYFTDRSARRRGARRSTSHRRGVREWAIQNAELWVRDYGIDGLRLDAVHAVQDDSDRHVLAELADRVHAVHPGALVISEMGPPDFRPLDEWGHDAMWLDSLHHALHVRSDRGAGRATTRTSTAPCPASRPSSRRPEARADRRLRPEPRPGRQPRARRPAPAAKRRVAAAVVLFCLYTPLLFLGEEYGESAPFQFFTDHIDPSIATRRARAGGASSPHFAGFSGEVPDPQDAATFERSRLEPARRRRRSTFACSACGASYRASWRSRGRSGAYARASPRRAPRCAPTSRNETVELDDVRLWPGHPFPLGPGWDGEGTNFSLFSEHAEKVELCLFDEDGPRDALSS